MADMPLPQAALAALQRGDKLGAIRIVREASGVDLKQAAMAVERHLRAQAAKEMEARGVVAQQALEALMRGKGGDALELLRTAGGKDLAPALDTLERMFVRRRDPAASHERKSEHHLEAQLARHDAHRDALLQQKRTPTVMPGDKPGGGLLWIVIALGAAALLIAVIFGG